MPEAGKALDEFTAANIRPAPAKKRKTAAKAAVPRATSPRGGGGGRGEGEHPALDDDECDELGGDGLGQRAMEMAVEESDTEFEPPIRRGR